MDIAEELDRINYHLESLDSILKAGGTVGRKLGFILQEIQGKLTRSAQNQVKLM